MQTKTVIPTLALLKILTVSILHIFYDVNCFSKICFFHFFIIDLHVSFREYKNRTALNIIIAKIPFMKNDNTFNIKLCSVPVTFKNVDTIIA